MNVIWTELGASPLVLLTTFIATTVMYWALILLFVILGRRIKTVDSYYLVAFGALIGAISARASLGLAPTMMSGLVSLATLLFWTVIIKRSGKFSLVRRITRKRVKKPVVVMIDGQVREAMLARYKIPVRQLYAALRQADIHRFEEVALVIFETKGTFTILHHGATLDREIFSDVVGIEEVRTDLFRN